MIWQCPVCGSTRSTNPGVCPICGYDESADREKHPTLICTPGGGTSLSAKIQERKAQKEQKEQKERQEKWNRKPEMRRPAREQAQKQEQKFTVSYGTTEYRRIHRSWEQPTAEKAQEKKSSGEMAWVIFVFVSVILLILALFLPFQVENREMNGAIYSGAAVMFGFLPKEGQMTYPNGNAYEGKFGFYTYPDGEGVCILADGTRYEGDWNMGKLVEEVTEIDGKKRYRGIQLSSDGAAYIGAWTGMWFDWNPTGQGTMYYTDGAVYTGAWENDAITGYGTYTWANGDRYEGDFVDNVRTGYGTYIWPNGDRYEGNFADDQMDGQGTFYDVDGTQTTGTWQEGVFMGS